MAEQRAGSGVALLWIIAVGLAVALFSGDASRSATATTTAPVTLYERATSTVVETASSQLNIGLRGPEVRQASVAHDYGGPTNLARASARPGEYRLAPQTTRHVIGGMEDLGPGSLRVGEATVASRLPGDAGNRLGNWLNNRDVLRSIMREGRPIRDASVDSAGNLLYQDTRRFITLERDFLRSNRWTYDPSTQLWMPPG